MILRELLAKFGVEYDNTGAKQADKDVSGLATAAKEMVGLIGGAAAIRGFGNFILGQTEMASAVGDTAKRIGVGIEALQELRYAASGAGLGAEAVDGALARLGRGAADAARGQGAAKDAFAELGVQLTDSSGSLLALDDIVSQVSDGLARTTNESDRARLGFDLFGREGSKFTETLKDGSGAVAELREEARALGGVLSEEQVESAAKADKALRQFRFSLQGVKNEIAARFIPMLTKGVGWLMDWVKAAQSIVRNSYLIEAALITAGAALAAFVGGARLLSITKAGLVFAVIALAIEDIIKTAQGGDTVISRFVDALGGKGATLVWIENWRAGVKILIDDAKELAKQLGDAWNAMEKLVAARKREQQEQQEPWRKGGFGAQKEYEAAHAEWEKRKKFLEDHPLLTTVFGLTGGGQLGPEPRPPLKEGEVEPEAPKSALDELRTRVTQAGQGMGGGPGRGMLLPEFAGQSAEQQALETREASRLAAQRSSAPPVVVNQTNSVRVNASGADAKEVARETVKALRNETKRAMRSVRQVAP